MSMKDITKLGISRSNGLQLGIPRGAQFRCMPEICPPAAEAGEIEWPDGVADLGCGGGCDEGDEIWRGFLDAFYEDFVWGVTPVWLGDEQGNLISEVYWDDSGGVCITFQEEGFMANYGTHTVTLLAGPTGPASPTFQVEVHAC